MPVPVSPRLGSAYHRRTVAALLIATHFAGVGLGPCVHESTANWSILSLLHAVPAVCSEEFREGARTPDHPHSLLEGWAAAACLWADLLQPDRAGFPFFELDI